MTVAAYSKPFTKRFRANGNQWLEMRDKLAPERCRVCGEHWTDLHHILPRDGAGTWPGGDDVTVNLAPLCRACHLLVETRSLGARSALRESLTPANLDYLKYRIGDRWHVFLDLHYPEAA